MRLTAVMICMSSAMACWQLIRRPPEGPGIFILDRNGDKLTGVIPLRYGLSISQDDAGSAVIGASP